MQHVYMQVGLIVGNKNMDGLFFVPNYYCSKLYTPIIIVPCCVYNNKSFQLQTQIIVPICIQQEMFTGVYTCKPLFL